MFAIVDTNEQATSPKDVQRLKQLFPKLQVQSLEFGDLNIILDNGDLLAIEHKTPGDFLGSIADGRVFRQVERMAQGAKWSCIVIEGNLSYDSETGNCIADGHITNWKGSSVRGAMMAIQWSCCPIIFTHDYLDALQEIIRFCSKSEKHQQMLGVHRVVSFPPVELKEEIIAAFPGIGLVLSRSLFEFAGKDNGGNASLAEALCWVSNFPKIDKHSRPKGWGDKTVVNFRTALGHAENEYLNLIDDGKPKKEKGKKNANKKRLD